MRLDRNETIKVLILLAHYERTAGTPADPWMNMLIHDANEAPTTPHGSRVMWLSEQVRVASEDSPRGMFDQLYLRFMAVEHDEEHELEVSSPDTTVQQATILEKLASLLKRNCPANILTHDVVKRLRDLMFSPDELGEIQEQLQNEALRCPQCQTPFDQHEGVTWFTHPRGSMYTYCMRCGPARSVQCEEPGCSCKVPINPKGRRCNLHRAVTQAPLQEGPSTPADEPIRIPPSEWARSFTISGESVPTSRRRRRER